MPHLSETPVIFNTAYDDPEFRAGAREAVTVGS